MADDQERLPNTDIENFAIWVVRNDEPRKRAIRDSAVKNGFKTAIEGVAEAQALGAEEIQFCEGWLYYALSELGGIANPDLLDSELKQRAERHLPPPGGYTTMSG